MFAAACSSEPEAAPPTLELTTTSVVITTTTSTTEAETTTTVDPRIAEVEALLLDHHAAYQAAIDDTGLDLAVLQPSTAGELLERLSRNLLMSRAEGRTYEGTFELSGNVQVSPLPGGRFLATACGRDAITAYLADGTVFNEADEDPLLRQYTVEPAANGLAVVDVAFAGGARQTCEL